MEREIPFRITVLQPPSGVTFRMQEKKDGLVPASQTLDDRLVFDFPLRLVGERAGGPPVFRGAFAQGPPSGRFVYINSGTSAGQFSSPWTRRAKIQLSGVTWDLIDQVLAGGNAVMEARFAGTGKDGGPACATVPLLDGGWRVSNQNLADRQL